MSAIHVSSNGTAGGNRPLRVLMIEDSEVDALLLEHALRCGGYEPFCHRVDTARDTAAALQSHPWDVILADHAMPEFSAPEALELVKREGFDVPFIIVSGHIEEVTAVAAMKAGAHDYIMKDRLARLVPAVERELREAAMRRAQKACEEELRRAHDELEMRVEQRTADLRAANDKLQKMFEERRRLENELLEIAENERRRIGFDLHDDLGQKLTGLAMMVKGLEQRLVRDRHSLVPDAQRIRELVEQVIHHTHHLAHQFSSLDLSGDDIAAVLKGLSHNVQKMFKLPCTLTLKGALPQLSGNTTAQFYKIAQEAISNAVKHGKATHIWITACRTADKLTLTIRNDGLPFTLPEEKKKRMGLRIMNYRANTMGAAFEIHPNPKGGTTVCCTLPIRVASRTHARSEAPVRNRAAGRVEVEADLAHTGALPGPAFQ